jgi:hypothetical protein
MAGEGFKRFGFVGFDSKWVGRRGSSLGGVLDGLGFGFGVVLLLLLFCLYDLLDSYLMIETR